MNIGSETISFYTRKTGNKFAVKNKVDEQKIAKMAVNGDRYAMDQLILSNIKFVERTAHKYAGYCNSRTGIVLDDLIQVGIEGLITASKSFDPNRNVKFITYAAFWIKAKLNDFVKHNSKLVSAIGTSAGKKLFFKQKLVGDLFDIRDPDERDEARKRLADKVSVSVNDVIDMEKRLFSTEVSMSTPMFDDTNSTFGDTLGTDDMADDTIHSKQIKDIVQEAIKKANLSERDSDILISRFYNTVTHEELAAMHGITRQRSHQIENSALAKVANALKDMGISKQDLI